MHLLFVPEGEFELIVHFNPQLLKGEQKAQTVLAILGIGAAFLEAMDCSQSMTK